MLVVIRTSASAKLKQAWQALRCMDELAACQHAEEAWQLIESKEIAECGMIACVLMQDSLGVKRWKNRLLRL